MPSRDLIDVTQLIYYQWSNPRIFLMFIHYTSYNLPAISLSKSKFISKMLCDPHLQDLAMEVGGGNCHFWGIGAWKWKLFCSFLMFGFLLPVLEEGWCRKYLPINIGELSSILRNHPHDIVQHWAILHIIVQCCTCTVQNRVLSIMRDQKDYDLMRWTTFALIWALFCTRTSCSPSFAK